MSAVELSEIARNWGIVIGGALGLMLALWRVIVANRASVAATRQADIARRAHTAEVFSTAVGLLGNERLEVRLGAIYALIRISHDFRGEYGGIVTDLLEVYVRQHARDSDTESHSVDVRILIEYTETMRRLRS